tara:strand:+ start:145 stop:348 length:204 start_codon:yes stop_codon:yes gene_type:complete
MLGLTTKAARPASPVVRRRPSQVRATAAPYEAGEKGRQSMSKKAAPAGASVVQKVLNAAANTITPEK